MIYQATCAIQDDLAGQTVCLRWLLCWERWKESHLLSCFRTGRYEYGAIVTRAALQPVNRGAEIRRSPRGSNHKSHEAPIIQ
jgi:hypothetical protein